MIVPSDAGSEARSSILKRLLKERVWEASPEVLRAGKVFQWDVGFALALCVADAKAAQLIEF